MAATSAGDIVLIAVSVPACISASVAASNVIADSETVQSVYVPDPPTELIKTANAPVSELYDVTCPAM
jgi:hypothetical protein